MAWLGHHSAGGGDGLLTYSRESVNGLRARGAKVFFLHHARAAEEAEDQIALKSIASGHRYIISSPRTKRRIAELIKRERVDVVHASLSFSPSIDFGLPDLCHELGVPVVATFHVPFDSRPSVWSATSGAIYRVYSQSLAAYDRVVIFSQAQRDLLVHHGVPAESVAVVPNGVDVDRYSPGPTPFKASTGARLLVGYLGRLDAEKNVDALARAFLDLGPPEDAQLVVAGSGSDRRRLERRYAGPYVRFLGQVTDEALRIAVLRALDVFVLPSTVEGLSLSLLEAMACGVATVATDVGSDGEALQGAGLVLDPRELDGQLRLALRTLVDFPAFREELGRRARERARERFSLARNLDRLLTIYEELRAGRPTRAALQCDASV